MMNRIKYCILLIIGAMAANAFTAVAQNAVESDSVAIVADSLLTYALDSYKDLKFLKAEGEAYDVTSPKAYTCYQAMTKALEAQTEGSKEWLQAKEVLRDLRGDLLHAAFFYSKNSDQTSLRKYAQGFIDICIMPAFKDSPAEIDNDTMAMLAYIAASGAYNEKDYAKAIDYFKAYLSTGNTAQLEQVYIFMTQSCLQANQWDLGIVTAEEAMKVFPTQKHIPLVAMQICIDGSRAEHLQKFLSQALEQSPADERLLDIQGKLYEDAGKYEDALGIYNTLEQLRPNSLSTTKHKGLCYYNQAVEFYNQAINQPDEKTAGRLRRKAKNYFSSAADLFRQVLESAPTAVPYLRSLGVCYLCLEDKYNFEKINERLRLLKEDPLAEVFMPPSMTYNGDGRDNFATSAGSALKDVPSYSEYGKEYITSRLLKWATKDEFERLDDFNKRVNQNTIKAEHEKLNAEAAAKYIEEYSGRLRINDLRLEPYDATNEVFKIVSSFGPIYVRVPLKNGEAEQFKNNWKGVRFQNPKFFIDNDSVRIAEITFMAVNGKKYDYNNAKSINYSAPNIYIDFSSIISGPEKTPSGTPGGDNSVYIASKSDVDENIPLAKGQASNTLALIIANENYKNVSKVPYAFADGFTFSQYCNKTFGLPKDNVTFCKDATLNEIYDAMEDLRRKAALKGPNCDIIVYYAGHGIPDDKTKDAYLLASDANPKNPRTWYKLGEFYSALNDMNTRSVMVFIDACFSGAERSEREDATIMAATGARAAVIKAQEAAPKGNMFILTAATGSETALPYREKGHGLFTYFMLKKLQESKGNASLKELSDYVTKEVANHSTFVIKKPQNPTVSTSGSMVNQWKSKKIGQ